MRKNKKHSAMMIASFVALLIVSVFGTFQLVNSFSGATKYNIEVWNGNVVESGDAVEEALGGITFEKEIFPNGVEPSAINYGDTLTVASGSKALTATDLCDSGVVTIDGDGYASAAAYRFPSGTNLITRCLPDVGDQMKVLFWNSSVDEVYSLNLTAGGYIDTWIASSSANVANDLFDNVTTDAGVWVKFLNFDGSTVSLTFEEVRDSD